MEFNFKLFMRLTYRAFFDNENTMGRMTWKRAKAVFLWYAVMPIHHLITWICFGLDNILFPGFKDQEVEAPVFIIGNFRSGSTLLQRILASDEENFTAMKLWEIYGAPSLTQRHFWKWVKRVDARIFRGFFLRVLNGWNQRNLDIIPMHKVNLWETDEDEGLMLHNYASTFLMFVFPFLDEMPKYHRFDTDLTENEKRIAMEFYRSCIKRHVYFHGGKRYVAKNPTFSVKIDSLREYFPGAKFIYLARNPLAQVASKTSFLSFIWNYFNDPDEKYPLREFVYEIIKHWYRDPLEKLDRIPSSERYILKYDDLTEDTEEVVKSIYQRFDLDISPEFGEKLTAAAENSRNYSSNHSYSLEDMGYTQPQTEEDFSDIFERFKFQPETPDISQKQSPASRKTISKP